MAAFFGSILFLLLFAVLFILVLGLNFLAKLVGGIRNLWNILTGKGFSSNNSRQNTGYYERETSSSSNSNTSNSHTSSDQGHRPHSKGVFGDDEGTYVDFEEIKN